MDIAHLTALLEYGHRATRRRLSELQTLTPADHARANRARDILAHTLATETVWLARIRGDEPDIAIWPELSLDDCEVVLTANRSALGAYLASLEPGGLDQIIDYTNSAGLRFRNTVRDILLHLVLHGTHHRGQLALLIRDLGGTPDNMDYITLAREERAAGPESGTSDSASSDRDPH